MKLIHKLRILAIGVILVLLTVFVTAPLNLSSGAKIATALIVGAVGVFVVLFLAVSHFIDRHSGKSNRTSLGESQKTLPNGVQVLVSKNGSGREIRRGRVIVASYSAYHGEVRRANRFDTTDGGKPVELMAGGKSNGAVWMEALSGLKAGARVRIIVPPTLGFGAKGSGSLVPPNATLTFDVEVIAVKYAD